MQVDTETLELANVIQSAPQTSVVVAEAAMSAVNPNMNFDQNAVPEFKPNDPAGPAPSTPSFTA